LKKFISIALLASLLNLSFPLHGGPTIIVDGNQTHDTLHRFWEVANFAKGRTLTFTSEEDVELLLSHSPSAREVVVDYALGGRNPDGIEYFHGLDSDGELITDFTILLNRIRTALNAGFTPWIGLENVPPLMSEPANWSVYGNSEPAKDNELFHRYVRLAMEAFIKAFGREEVASWKFIIATEPDLNPGHWTGTKEEFLELMDHTLEAVLEVLPEASISPGNILNPAYAGKSRQAAEKNKPSLVRSRDHWGLDIIDHMAKGSIHPDGRPGSKLDFFSFSWYARIGRSTDSFDLAVNNVRDRLGAYPQYKNIPVDIREFAVLIDDQGHRLYAGDASEWGASFYASIARKVYDYKIRNVFEWDSATQGVLHPRGQVISMLDQMAGGKSIEVKVKETDPSMESGAIACRKDGSLYVLVYNHQAARLPVSTQSIHLEISDPLFSDKMECSLSEWTIDKDHASWIYTFLEDAAKAGLQPLPSAGLYEGSPRRLLGDKGVDLFKANIDRYRALSQLPQTKNEEICPVAENRIDLELTMPSHSVRLLKLTPRHNPTTKVTPAEEIFARVNAHDFHPLNEGESMTLDRNLQEHGIADLDDEDWKVRLLAVRDLVSLEGIEAADIITGLKHENRHVRLITALALGILGEKEAVPSLEQIASTDSVVIVRSQAVIALGQIEATASVPLLKNILANDSSKDVRHQCELAIDQIKKQMGASAEQLEAFRSLDEKNFELLQVGKVAPDFELHDTDGKAWKLSDFRGRKTVVLVWVFADWCPVCHGEFRDLIDSREAFDDANIQLFTMECHDLFRGRVMVGKELDPEYWFAKESFQDAYTQRIWWPHLLDRAGAVGATYGIDPMAFAVHAEFINRPSTIIIDKDGIVRLAYYGTFWGDRPTIEQTVKMVESGNFEYEHPKRLP